MKTLTLADVAIVSGGDNPGMGDYGPYYGEEADYNECVWGAINRGGGMFGLFWCKIMTR